MIIGISGYIGSGKDTVALAIQMLTNTERDYRKLITGKPIESLAHWLELQQEYPGYKGNSTWQVKKFAAKLKQMVSLLTGIPVSSLEKQEVKALKLGPEWNWWWYKSKGIGSTLGEEIMVPFQMSDIEGFKKRYSHLGADQPYLKPMTVRELLQKLGTDAVRDKVHPDAWVNALFADYQSNYKHPPANQDNLPIIPIYPNWVISDCRFPNEAQVIKDRGGVIWRIERGLRPDGIPHLTAPHPSETGLDSYKFDYTIYNDGSLEELLIKVREALKIMNLL